MSVTTLSNPTFTQVGDPVVYTPYAANDNAAGSTQVTLTDSTGTIISGVTAVRFHLSTYCASGDAGYSGEIGVIREFDVVGAPTAAPEPGLMSLFAVAGLALSRRVRRLA